MLLGTVLLPVTPAHAFDEAFVTLTGAKSLRCSVGPGASSNWQSGRSVVEKATFGKDVVLHFDAIDLRTGKARVIGNAGAENVAAWGTQSGVHFVEQTTSGNVVLSTVFAERASNGEFMFVTSRHMNLSGGPLPSQFHGTCKPW
jgi:hypothetical protein